ncbi:MAG: type IX secretion system outer membrane channel protein PorV, partial [Pedobacter sp.]
AKYAFATDAYGISASYTPYLTDIANDISLGQLTFYNRFQERMAFAASLRYFGLGDIELRETGNPDEIPVTRNPNELAVDLSYALQLSETFSMAVAGRYIRSNLRIPEAAGGGDSKPASSFAFDVAAFYQSEEVAFEDFNGRWRGGVNLQNLGPKISYDNDEELSSNFLPANLRLGAGFDFIFDEYNKVGLTGEFTKLLVPTPQDPDLDGDGETTTDEYIQANRDYQNINWVSGVFKSFGDAPDGFREELQEVTYAIGAEYMYQDSFAFRLGYFNENANKGARKFFALGAGFRYTVIKVDLSYLFSASQVRNPLENTLRFSLTFNFGDKYDEY